MARTIRIRHRAQADGAKRLAHLAQYDHLTGSAINGSRIALNKFPLTSGADCSGSLVGADGPGSRSLQARQRHLGIKLATCY